MSWLWKTFGANTPPGSDDEDETSPEPTPKEKTKQSSTQNGAADASNRSSPGLAVRGRSLTNETNTTISEDDSGNGQELEAMYDAFSRFTPAGEQDGTPAGRRSSEPEAAYARRVRMVEAKLQQREEELEEKVDSQDRKLIAASRALQRTRAQVQQLTAQLGLKDLEGSKLECKVISLRNLLIEKEKRLQAALDEATFGQRGNPAASSSQAPRIASAGKRPEEFQPRFESAAEAVAERAQQPQEPPMAAAQGAGIDEAQLRHMAHIAEELTQALEAARQGEEEARTQSAEALAQLQAEQQRAAQYQRDLEAARQLRDAEVEALRARVEEQARAIAEATALAQDAEERSRRLGIADAEERSRRLGIADAEERSRRLGIAERRVPPPSHRGRHAWHPPVEC